MRQGLSRPPNRRTPWYARAETRLGAVLIAVLILAAGAAAAAREDEGGPEPSGVTVALALPPRESPTPDAQATAEATPTPTPAPTRAPMVVDLRPERVGQGETMLVWVHAPGAFAVTLEFADGVYSLLPESDVFWGVVGLPIEAGLGEAELTVTARSSTNEFLDAATLSYEVVAVERPVDYVTLTDEMASVLTPEASERERELRAGFFAQFDSGRRWTTFFRRPVSGVTTTEFGQGRSYNGGPVGGFHSGLDVAAPEGTPVLAAAPGRVAWVGEMPIRGISVLVDHGAGVKTGYHHLQSAAVVVGDRVGAGQLIGALGATGLATGPHLHWELTVWGVNVDPVSWTLKDFTP